LRAPSLLRILRGPPEACSALKIAVCVKRVPATDTRVRVAGDGTSIEASGVEFVLNPYDEFAIEEALKLREKAGKGEVVVLSLGPAEAQKELRTALAMGADSAVLLKDPSPGTRDDHSIAAILAAKLREISPDVVFFGKQAVDADGHQVGARVATLLGMACVCEIVKLEIGADGKVLAEREVEGGREIVEAKLPCIFTAQKGLNEPRYASLKGIMAAKKKPLEEAAFEEVPPGLVGSELTLPPPRPPGRVIGKGTEAVPELIRLLREEAKIL